MADARQHSVDVSIRFRVAVNMSNPYAGILIGGGGTIAATEGTDVELPAGTVLRVRMDAPLNLRR
jgi:hypothetical protein